MSEVTFNNLKDICKTHQNILMNITEFVDVVTVASKNKDTDFAPMSNPKIGDIQAKFMNANIFLSMHCEPGKVYCNDSGNIDGKSLNNWGSPVSL